MTLWGGVGRSPSLVTASVSHHRYLCLGVLRNVNTGHD